MLPVAQEASDYEANPFAAEQAECDETALDSCDNVHVLKDSSEKSRLAKRTHRMPFCVLQNINLILILLPLNKF